MMTLSIVMLGKGRGVIMGHGSHPNQPGKYPCTSFYFLDFEILFRIQFLKTNICSISPSNDEIKDYAIWLSRIKALTK